VKSGLFVHLNKDKRKEAALPVSKIMKTFSHVLYASVVTPEKKGEKFGGNSSFSVVLSFFFFLLL